MREIEKAIAHAWVRRVLPESPDHHPNKAARIWNRYKNTINRVAVELLGEKGGHCNE